MATAIGLIDCNNFYASCEQAFDAKLVARPVVVLSNNDGNVIARSNEAKQLGIKMGEPAFKVYGLFEEYDVQVLSSNYELYGDMSARVADVIREFSPEVEVYSIDECFISLDPAQRDSLTEQGQAIRERVRRYTGIPVSVGIATTKTLAKIANYHAKRSMKANGCLDLTNSPHLDTALARTPVEEVWGVGFRYAAMLQRNGIHTALDLRNAPDEWIRDRMTIVGLRTAQELRGIGCHPLELTSATRKSITVSRSFGACVETLEDLRAAVAYYVARAAEKLRREKLVAGAITVWLETNRFSQEARYSNSVTLELAPLTDTTPELMAMALSGITAIFKPGYRYKKAGVLLTNLVPAATLTMRLWGNEHNEKMRSLMEAMDSLNEKFGRDAVKVGLLTRQGKWRTRFGQRSPRYTTKWNELLQVA